MFLFATVIANGQTEKRDSLLKLLPSTKEDTGKVMLLLRMADTYEANNQDSSVYYLEESKKLSDLLGFRRGLYHYYAQSVIVSFTKGDYDLAMKQSNDALIIARELKDSNFIINTLGNTGIVFQYTGQFEKELEYSLEALAIGEGGNHKEKLSSMYQSVGNAYYNLRQFRKAISYTLLALKIHRETGSNSYPNRIYASLGQNYAELKNTDSACIIIK